METNPSVDHLRAWRNTLTAYARIVIRLEHELHEAEGLLLAWYEVLLLLRESPTGELRMHELAELRLLSRSAATRMVDRMEDAGLVHRHTFDDDHRGVLVALTDNGLRTLRRCAPIHLRGIQEHFARHLTLEEAAVVEEAMGRMAAALRPQAET